MATGTTTASSNRGRTKPTAVHAAPPRTSEKLGSEAGKQLHVGTRGHVAQLFGQQVWCEYSAVADVSDDDDENDGYECGLDRRLRQLVGEHLDHISTLRTVRPIGM